MALALWVQALHIAKDLRRPLTDFCAVLNVWWRNYPTRIGLVTLFNKKMHFAALLHFVKRGL